MRPPKIQGSDITSFTTYKLPDHPVLPVLTNHVTNLGEETDPARTTVAAELKSEVGHIEAWMTDLRNTTNAHLQTEDRNIDPSRTISSPAPVFL